ncbi:hypothetical protein [Streptomyces sp. 8N706]|uniref:hypothetical protein n=1 Tax=Streptomyces sp. 8N706 TaxID=3457416 RepID=UPI003FCEF1FC
MLTPDRLRKLNLRAQFTPADYSDHDTPGLPVITVAGAACFFYIDDTGTLCLSVHLDALDDDGRKLWGERLVPVRVTVEDTVLYDSRADEPSLLEYVAEAQKLTVRWRARAKSIRADRPLAHNGPADISTAIDDARKPFERAAWDLITSMAKAGA